ncbi:MAG: ABC transporter permease [Maledivibacter sp.]|nr:ABC transporter permease [Maledivibacter sp.]
MMRNIIKRIVFIIPTIILISLLSFAFLYYAPGDTATRILREKSHTMVISDEYTQEFIESKGLNRNFVEMYLDWLSNVIKGDLGKSYLDGQSINNKISEPIKKTLIMVLVSLVVYFLLGTSMGILSAIYKNGILDKLARWWSVLSMSIPVFWISLFIVWLLSVRFGILKIVGKRSNSCLILPGVLMGVIYTGNLITIVKHKTLLVLEEQYVLSTRALGVKQNRILLHHVLKNVLAPIVAASTLAFSSFLGSSVLMESIFSISGFGTLLMKAVNLKDYMVVASATLVLGLLVSVANMIADILYSYLDRRGTG